MIKRLWLGWRICRKQGVKFKPKFRRSFKGTYWWWPDGSKAIEINLFSPNFWEIFFHELGHKLEQDRTQKNVWSRIYRDSIFPEQLNFYTHQSRLDCSTQRLLGEESTASRTAIKLLRKFGLETPQSKRVLEQAFYTYTNGLTGELKAGACYAGYRKICH